MRVLHVYKTYYPDSVGGVEQVLFQLTRSLALQGVENRLFVMSPDAQPAVIERPEASVYRCRQALQIASTPMALGALPAFRAQLKWADVVHYQFPWPFADLLHFLSPRSCASVVTYQSDVVRQKWLLKPYRLVMTRFLRSVDRVVATSSNYIASSPVLSSLERQVDMIPNGMEAPGLELASAERVAYWRRLLGEGFFLFVGVLRYYKGLHTLVEAARGVNQTIVIAGEGPEFHALSAQVAAMGVQNVKLIGAISEEDKAALFQLALAFVFPSHLRSEAFGMSLVEAASYARPMVSCDIGTGTSFVNVNGRTGLTVAPERPEALAGALRQLLLQPADTTTAMGQAARSRFEQLFTAERMASSYLTLYREIAADHH